MTKKIFLFSIDLEDVRDGVPNGEFFKERVIPNTLKYLEWLNTHNSKCTFFVLGTVAIKYPDLIKEIIHAGHEIACHTFNHIPLDKQTEDSFKEDIDKNINALIKCGAKNISGFRAPIFSLTQDTSWAYPILQNAGISYSSSVLPAKNPLYGWPDFGSSPKKITNKLIEIPITVNKFGPLTLPFAGGVYFRCLPFSFIKHSFQKAFNENNTVLSYFHPYDIDTEQEKFMHGGINNSKFYNFLMYYNRKNIIKRLDAILDLDLEIKTYAEYLKNIVI